MIVRKCEVIKVEAIVRGYITGTSTDIRPEPQGKGECGGEGRRTLARGKELD
jgi:phosphoribosylaminoimidazole-succinocarboxamide synthase